jgi:hypothetical protein
MKITEVVRKSCYVATVTLLCFGPGAFAQSKVANTASVTSLTSGAGVAILNPITDDWFKKRKKRVAAAEGGSAALYLLLAGIACSGAMFVRSRRTQAEKSV